MTVPQFGDEQDTGSDLIGTTGALVKFISPQRGGNSIASEVAGQLNVDGALKLFATAEGGWIDIHPLPQIPAIGATIPTMTAWSAPHGIFSSPKFSAIVPANVTWFSFHLPHAVNPAAGVYLHAHFIVDSASTTPVVVQWDYSYAHGYARGVFPAPTTATATITPNGTPKTHYIAELAAPILEGLVETDGIIKTRFQLLSGPDILVEVCDAHVKLLGPCSENRNYPFGTPV
jgi:hypothetical protein